MKKLKIIKIVLILILSIITLLNNHALFSPDTTDQYFQAINNIYQDWHPPIMAYSWRQLIRLTNIKEVIYYIYYLFFILGVYSISKYIEKKSYFMSILFIVLTFILVRLGGTIFYIWKDTGMLSSYLLAIGLILNIKYGQKILALVILLIIFYGTSLRSNAIFASLPLILLLFYKLKKNNKLILLKSFFVWMVMIFIINFINYNFLNTKKLYPIQYIYISDIINMSMRKKIKIPKFLNVENYPEEELKERYINQPNINQYLAGKKPMIKMIGYGNYSNYNDLEIKENYERVKNYWIKLVSNNKLLFFKLKIKFFIELLSILLLITIYNFFIQVYLFFKKKLDLELLFLYISSIFYLLPYLIFNASYDMRYILYPIIIESFLFIHLTYINFETISNNIKKIIKLDKTFTEELKYKK